MKILNNLRRKWYLFVMPIPLALIGLITFPSRAQAACGGWWDVGCNITNSILEPLVQQIKKILKDTLSFWMNVRFENIAGSKLDSAQIIGDTLPADELAQINMYLSYARGIAGVAATAALIVFFVTLAKTKHEGNIMDRLGKLFWVVLGTLVAAGAIGLFTTVFQSKAPDITNMLTWSVSMYYPLAMTCAAISLIITGIRTITSQDGKPLKKFFEKMLLVMFIATLGPDLLMLVGRVLDNFSHQLIETAFGGDSGIDDLIRKVVEPHFGFGDGGVGLIGGILLFILLTITSLILSIVMVIRSIMLIMLAGFLVLYAALYDTEIGKKGFESLWTWIIALLLFKPAAATVYAVGFKFLAISDDDNKMVYFIGTLLMAIFALPALVKIIAPTTAAVAGGGSAGSAMMAASMMAQMGGNTGGTGLPTGAVNVPPGSGASGAGAGAGASGASGAMAAGAGPVGLGVAAAMSAGKAFGGAVNAGVSGSSSSSAGGGNSGTGGAPFSSGGNTTGAGAGTRNSSGVGSGASGASAGFAAAGGAASAGLAGMQAVSGGVEHVVGQAGGDDALAASGAQSTAEGASNLRNGASSNKNATTPPSTNTNPRNAVFDADEGPTGYYVGGK
ncbi:MAG: hypothetical protein LBI63_03195 [Candidatus Ancillula sp.]|jgi:hypothetical protein|nr:hypothetical protein [Candidatus Ancillula sp.]